MPLFARRLISELLVVETAAWPGRAWAVPNFNFDIGPGEALLILLLLALLVVGIPALIAVLVRGRLVHAGKVPRSGFSLPICLACLGWMLSWVLQLSLGGLVAGLPLVLYWVLPLGATAGAAALGTCGGEG